MLYTDDKSNEIRSSEATIDQLVSVLDKNTVQSLKKPLIKLKSTKATNKPNDERTETEIIRKKSKQKVVKEMNKWQPVVNQMKYADKLVFPSNNTDKSTSDSNILDWIYNGDSDKDLMENEEEPSNHFDGHFLNPEDAHKKNVLKMMKPHHQCLNNLPQKQLITKIQKSFKFLTPKERILVRKLQLQEALIQRAHSIAKKIDKSDYERKRHYLKKIKSKSYHKRIKQKLMKENFKNDKNDSSINPVEEFEPDAGKLEELRALVKNLSLN